MENGPGCCFQRGVFDFVEGYTLHGFVFKLRSPL